MIKFTEADAQVAQPELPPAILQSKEMLDDGTLRLVVDFPMNFPDEAVKVSTRAIKDEAGNDTNQEKITSKTYGLGRNISLGLQDNDKNLLEFTGFIRARTPAEKQAAAAADIVE